ncbi:dihydrofolate reductase family protein [Flavobacterium sp.]|uniref:dihydrofolate reductase family protein n=1 Tax=Flavobacterium sp. TaxID=239 RepID=UPI003428B1EF
MGRKTYDWITQQCEFPHKDKKTYVITQSLRPNKGTIEFYNGDLPELVNTLKSQPGKNIYCDGGASIIQQLLKHKLIDEMTISIIPILLGTGKKLFSESIPEELLQCASAKSFDTGLVQLHYKRIRR